MTYQVIKKSVGLTHQDHPDDKTMLAAAQADSDVTLVCRTKGGQVIYRNVPKQEAPGEQGGGESAS